MRTSNHGLFITGTDTSVGKTYVGLGIAKSLTTSGLDVGVMKPVETGCRISLGRLVPGDALRLMKAAGVNDALSLVSPCRYRKPLAPSVAGRLEGNAVDRKKILAAYRTLARRHEFMIVEGAGGIMVPLRGRYTCLDLVRELGLPVLVVARPGLGTINHTLLTVTALKQAGLTVSGIVINYCRDGKGTLAEKTNPREIEDVSGISVLGIVRHRSRCFDDIACRLQQKTL